MRPAPPLNLTCLPALGPFTLLTIGFSGFTFAEFKAVLAECGVSFLIDVRSVPLAQYKPEFNRTALEGNLPPIRYAWWGQQLGGRPADPSIFNKQGAIVYEQLVQRPQFQEGLQRLWKAHEQDQRVALMCLEADPATCHRSKAIGAALSQQYGLDIPHLFIDSRRTVRWRSQQAVAAEYNASRANLFGVQPLQSVKTYG